MTFQDNSLTLISRTFDFWYIHADFEEQDFKANKAAIMSDQNFPKPEDIQKEFEDFVKKRFGGQVQVISQDFPMHDRKTKKSVEEESSSQDLEEVKNLESLLEFRMTPKEVKSYLDRFVIGQDDAKRALSIAFCDHYNHVRDCYENDRVDADYAKQNVLVLGPTGVGKTYLVRQMAKLAGVPFVKADATRFSETGYMGANVDDLVKELAAQANDDLEVAQFGIIYLDEVDKLSAPSQQHGRDVTGRGVQLGLLKLMEETDVDLRGGHDPASQMQAFMEMQQKGKVERKVLNTRHILFVVSGAFTGLSEIIGKRLCQQKIGFGSDNAQKIDRDSETSLLREAQTQDFIDYGFEPEFIGRLPVKVSCQPLKAEDLLKVLKDSEGSILHQYKRAFEGYGLSLDFDEDALLRIAELAAEEKTGARGLMSVCENLLRDFKFELPSSGVEHLQVTSELIDFPQVFLKRILSEVHPKTAQVEKDLKDFSADFENQHGMSLTWTPEAIQKIIRCEVSEDIVGYCRSLLHGYEYGLKLIEQNTGKKDFVLSGDVIADPRLALERMIRESYESQERH
ncbi:MAG: AAA family ATPase [Oligoflexales bacterium]